MSEEKTAVTEAQSIIKNHARSLYPSDRGKAVHEASSILNREKQQLLIEEADSEEHQEGEPDFTFIPPIEDVNIMDFVEQLPEKREELAESIVHNPQRKEHVMVLTEEAPVSKIEIPDIETEGQSVKLSIDTNGKSAGTVTVRSTEIQYNLNGTKSQAANSTLELTPNGGLKFERKEYNYETGEPNQISATIVPAREETSKLTPKAFQHIDKLINQAKPPKI